MSELQGTASSRAWIFQANPEIFDIRGACAALDQIQFSAKQARNQVQVGDRVYLWESGRDGGIVGVGRITTEPAVRELPEDERPFLRDASRLAIGSESVVLAIEDSIAPPLHRSRVKIEPGLENLSILSFAQGTNFQVDESENTILGSLVDRHRRGELDESLVAESPSARREARRRDVAAARSTIESLLPDAEARNAVYRLLADTIRKAHAASPRSWSVSLFKRSVRMNVGVMMTLDVTQKGVRVYVDPQHVSADTIERLEQGAIRSRDLVGLPGYYLDGPDFLKLVDSFREGYIAFVDRALARSQRTAFHRSYSPAVVELLREELEEDLPDPRFDDAVGSASIEGPMFTWIDFYGELAEKILTYEDRQQELIDWLSSLQEEGVKVIDLMEHLSSGEAAKISDIDPFTFFATFNRGTRIDHRFDLFARLRDQFELDSDVPKDVYGIPIVNNQSSRFFDQGKHRETHAIPELWQLARQAVLKGPDGIDGAVFDRSLAARSVGMGKLTMGLFWLSPHQFLPMDANTRALLESQGISAKPANWSEYFELLKVASDRFDSFHDLSYEARMRRGNADVIDETTPVWKISPETGGRYWEMWKEKGVATIGWDDLGDLTDCDEAEFHARRDEQLEAHPDWNKGGPNQVWKFRCIPVGAKLVANRGTTSVLGVGTVVGGYFFDESAADHRHRLLVKWDDVAERTVDRPGWRRTLIRLKPADLEEILGGASVPDPWQEPETESNQLDFAGILAELDNHGLQFPEETVATYLLALQTKRFVLLSGISGTGKTQLALAVARAFQAGVDTEPPIAALQAGTPRKVLPYMVKYHRFALNSAFVEQHPELLDAITNVPLQVRVPGADPITQSVYRKPDTDRCWVLLSGDVRGWFDDNLTEGDTFLLNVEEDEDGVSSILSIDLPTKDPRNASPSSSVIIPVRPDWTDARGLLGFHNPLLGTYVMTPTLRLLLEARDEIARAKRGGRPPRPYFLILDEMNLARVEHYFSDFLSASESGKPILLHEDPRIEEENGDDDPVPRRLDIPSNLYVTGTVNVDETTYMFSPKVLDRAFTLEFNEVDLTTFRPLEDVGDVDEVQSPLALEQFNGALLGARKPSAADWQAMRRLEAGKLSNTIEDLNKLLEREHRHFGYRVASEIARFVNLANEQASGESKTLWTALDVAILSKVLVKLHGTQQELEIVLADLRDFCITGASPKKSATASSADSDDSDTASAVDPLLPRSKRKLERMLRRLHQQGFTSFIE